MLDRVKEIVSQKGCEGRQKQGMVNIKQKTREEGGKVKETWEKQKNSKKIGMKLPCLTGEDKGSNFSQDILQVE